MQSPLHFLVCMLLFLSFMAGTTVAQHKAPEPIILTWDLQEAVFPVQGHEARIPAFKGASIDLLERLPYYRLSIPNIHLTDFNLTEAVYSPFSTIEQQQFKGITFSTEAKIEITNARQNKQPVSIVSILPIRRNPQTKQLEKLTRFSYTYTSGTTTTQNINRTTAGNYSPNSVLSAGEWYKLAVTQSGIHKIDKAMLQGLGINTQSIDPKTIQLFGNGGGMLPQLNSVPVPDDLQENAIVVSGEQDGQFNDNDFILFYGQGPHTWNYNQQQDKFEHTYNIYSDTTFYFLRVGYAPGARVQLQAPATGGMQTITTYNERAFHERDLASIIHSGREWYGEDFSTFNPTREISFPVTGIIPNSEVKLSAAVMGNSATDCSFSLKIGNNLLGTIPIAGRGTYNYHPEGINGSKTFTFNQQQLGSITDAKATITFNMPSDATANGYLNHLEMNYNRQLKLYNDQTAFRATASIANPVSNYSITDAPATAQVWDVTNPLRPSLQQTNYNSSLQFSATSDILREFIVFTANNISLKPIVKGKVVNQNLHSLNLNGDIDHIILTHPSLQQQANRLAEHRNTKSNLKSIVVTTTQVYNEFSSGAQDVTAIRNFMRLLYKRSNKSSIYLLLLGDASYDYKNRIPVNTNLVPVYESRQSLHPIASYSSEDYYGFLDDEEGEWAENNLGDHLLDIGIGRLPAKNAQEAAILVDKIIAYESNNHFGKWRSAVTLVSDDGDFNEHQEDAEFLADFLEKNAPDYTTNKLYVDLYRQEAVANGQRAPKLNQDLTEAVQKGTLLVNYTGHGNEVSWASEQILTLHQVKEWQNPDNLTFMLTATCEFGRYDDPARVSGAEVAMLHANGAAVGLVTTTRPVYSSSNRVLNRNFFKSAFTPPAGTTPRLGDLVLQTKNNSITDNVSGSRGVYNRNFTLLCDPAVRLASPDLKAEITHINGKAVSTDTLSALGKVTMQGRIATTNGVTANYSGTLRITIYEKQTIQQTYGDENSPVVPVTQRQNVLYEGSATIANGLFSVSFVVPKDIAYQYGPGKITLYASNTTQDALGSNTTITVGGTSKNIATDNTPPTINLYLEDESFVFGGSTGQDPNLLIKLFDENGINTAGLGIGHELIAILDDNEENPVILNDYYTSDKDSYQRGRINYSLRGLTSGPHSIRFKAWDTHNNASEEYIEFHVSNTEEFSLDHVLNYPNPFSTKTTFHFNHNRAGEDLDIQVQIYTISGKLIKTLQTISIASPAHVAALTWNGRDEYNDLLARGVYVYKVSVRSRKNGAGASKFEKLVILN